MQILVWMLMHDEYRLWSNTDFSAMHGSLVPGLVVTFQECKEIYRFLDSRKTNHMQDCSLVDYPSKAS
jgi:hypothetical protein